MPLQYQLSTAATASAVLVLVVLVSPTGAGAESTVGELVVVCGGVGMVTTIVDTVVEGVVVVGATAAED